MPLSVPGPRQNPSGPQGCWAEWCQLLERGPGNLGLVVAKALGSKNASIAQLPDAFAFYTEYSVMALGDNGDKGQECISKALYKVRICYALQPK